MSPPLEKEIYYSQTTLYETRLSPDGEIVAYRASEAEYSGDEMLSGVFTFSKDDDSIHRLTTLGEASRLRWHPQDLLLGVVAYNDLDYSVRSRPAQARYENNNEIGAKHRDEDVDDRQVWAYDLDNGGEPKQLTSHPHPVWDFDWSPDGTQLVFVSREPVSSDYRMDLGAQNPNVREHGRTTTDQPSQTNVRKQLYIVDLQTGDKHKIDGAFDTSDHRSFWYRRMDPSWGPNNQIAFSASKSGDSSERHIYTVSPSGERLSKQSTGLEIHLFPDWSPDGRKLKFSKYYNEKSWGPRGVHVNSVGENDGGPISVTEEFDRNVDYATWVDNETLTAMADVDGRRVLVDFDVTGSYDFHQIPVMKSRTVSPTGPERTFDVTPEAATLSAKITGPNMCGIRTFERKEDDTWTQNDDFQIDVNNEILGRNQIFFGQFDFSRNGKQLHGTVYAPEDPDTVSDDSFPVIFDFYSGPFGFSPPEYRFRYHYWTSRGFAVLKIHQRGSQSFGPQYSESLIGKFGELDVNDIKTGIDHVSRKSWADESAIYAAGFNYGATIVSLLLARTDLLAAGACLHGLYDIPSIYGDSDLTDVWKEYIGEPWENQDAYAKISPFHSAESIEDPMLLITGEDDTNAPPSQSRRLYEYLKGMGKDVKLVEYPDHYHTPRGSPKVAIDKLRIMNDWFS